MRISGVCAEHRQETKEPEAPPALGFVFGLAGLEEPPEPAWAEHVDVALAQEGCSIVMGTEIGQAPLSFVP